MFDFNLDGSSFDNVENPITHIRNFDAQKLRERTIQISQHCYGCTAGAGSSCQGTIT